MPGRVLPLRLVSPQPLSEIEDSRQVDIHSGAASFRELLSSSQFLFFIHCGNERALHKQS